MSNHLVCSSAIAAPVAVLSAEAQQAQAAAQAQKRADDALFMMRLRTYTNWLNAVLDKKRLQVLVVFLCVWWAT